MLSKRIFILLLGLVLILTACAQSSNVTGEPAVSEVIEETDEPVGNTTSEEIEEPVESPSTDETEEPVEKEEDAEEPGESPVSTEPESEQALDLTSMSGCRTNEPLTAAYDVLSPPTEDDWSLGKEDAYVTIIEYGDFQ